MQITSEMIAWVLVLYLWFSGGRTIVHTAPLVFWDNKEKREAFQSPLAKAVVFIIWPFIWFFC